MFGKKLLPGLAVVALLVLAGSASAVDYVHFDGTVDDQWSNPANWSGGVLPTSAEGVGINYGISAEIAGIDAEAGPMYIYGDAHVTVSSGSFTAAFGQNYDIYEGALSVTGGNVVIGETVYDLFHIGAHSTSGVVNVSGGKITVQTMFLPHTAVGSVGVVNLSGGEMEVVERIYFGADGVIDITDSGVLRFTSVYSRPVANMLQTWVDAGSIITTGFCGELVITEIDPNEATVHFEPFEPTGFKDLRAFVDQWLDCTDPQGAGCIDSSGVPTILQGTATVDGDLSEWAGADWITMDKIYDGDPNDVSNAKWAARWDDTNNLIYVAVTVDDANYVFDESPVNWVYNDGVEVYIDPDNEEVELYGEAKFDINGTLISKPYQEAQQWVIYANSGIGTIILADYGLVPGNSPVYASAHTGTTSGTLTYEIALDPYDFYDVDDGGNNVLLDLEAGHILGLDVTIVTKDFSYNTGMLCQHTTAGMSTYAANMTDYRLGPVTGCGAWGYMESDFNEDCKVDFEDFAVLAGKWLQLPEQCQ